MFQAPYTIENQRLEPENTLLEKEKHLYTPPILGFHVDFRGCTQIPTRWAPTSYKWSYSPYKWPYKNR